MAGEDDGRFGDAEGHAAAANTAAATPEELSAFYGQPAPQAPMASFYTPNSPLDRLFEGGVAGVGKRLVVPQRAKSGHAWTLPLLHDNYYDAPSALDDAVMLQHSGLSQDEEDDGDFDSAEMDDKAGQFIEYNPGTVIDYRPSKESTMDDLIGEDMMASILEFEAARQAPTPMADPVCVEKESTKWNVTNDIRKMMGSSMYCDPGQALMRFNLRKDTTKMWWSFRCCRYTGAFAQCTSRLTDERDSLDGSPMRLNGHNLQCEARSALTGWELVDTPATRKIQLRYQCCELPWDATFQVCAMKQTGVATSTQDLSQLMPHQAECGSKEAMRDWYLGEDGGKFRMTYTCCNLGTVPMHGAARTCAFVGEKHIINFDGQLAQQGGSDVFWLVKSEFVQIQALINASVREISVTGRFLQGHRLKILSNGSALWNDEIVPAVGLEQPGVATISVTKVGSRFVTEASLPLSVQLVTNCTPGTHLNGFITMEEFPGSQTGRCGNNNGFADDDPVLPFVVPRQERTISMDELGGERLHWVSTCNMCGFNFCSRTDLQFAKIPSELVIDAPLSLWGCEGRDFSLFKIYRESSTGAVFVVEETGKYDMDNPSEFKRAYSSVHANDGVNGVHGRSKIDSPQAWSAGQNTIGQWMTIELTEVKRVQGVWLQGRRCDTVYCNQVVTKVNFESSVDCKTYVAVDGGKAYDTGVKPGDVKYLVKFALPITAQCVKIVVHAWQHHISMRAALSTKLVDLYVTANPAEKDRTYSTIWDYKNCGEPCRQSMLGSTTGWFAQNNRADEWMNMQLPSEAKIRGVLVQSRAGHNQWVTQVEFEQSRDCISYTKVDELKTATPNVYAKMNGAGGWGGMCTCPDGKQYNVGDMNNGCGSLTCNGGTPGSCERVGRAERTGMGVVCGGTTKTFDTGIVRDDGELKLLLFSAPVAAKCIRIKVKKWVNHISMRAGLSIAFSSKAEFAQWQGQASKLRTIDECDFPTYFEANKTCATLLTGGDYLQDFMHICIYDACFGTNADMYKEDVVEQQAFLGEQQMISHRQMRLNPMLVGADIARTSCQWAQKLPTIRSRREQRAVQEAANDLDGIAPSAVISDLVWLGGKWSEPSKAWQWDDGSDICGYLNWADTQQTRLGKSNPFLCMSRRTGKWFACLATDKLSFMCADPKTYTIGSVAKATATIGSCGLGEQVAMPKGTAEQLKVQEVLAGHPGLMWLGGWYVRDHWEWFDRTNVCFTNWDVGEPKHVWQDVMICVVPVTGKWRTCQSMNEEHPAVCESDVKRPVCPAGRLDATRDLGLSVMPLNGYGMYENYCLYMSIGTEDCHTTCAKQVNGVCSESGMHVISENPNTCKFAVENFGGIWGSESALKVSDRGCTYIDTGNSGLRQIMYSNGTSEASCDSRSGSKDWHTVCACDLGSDDYPESHIMTEGDIAHVTAGGFDEKPIFIDFVKAYSEDCTDLQIKDGVAEHGRAGPVRNDFAWITTTPWTLDLGANFLVDGLVTRGTNEGVHKGLNTFRVSYGVKPPEYTQLPEVFTYDNTNPSVTTILSFREAVTAQYIMIIPLTWDGPAAAFKISASVCGLKRNETQRLALLETGAGEDNAVLLAEGAGFVLSPCSRSADAPRSDVASLVERRLGQTPVQTWNLMTLQVDPPTGLQAGKLGWCIGAVCTQEAVWPFGAKNESWSIDIKADADQWGAAIWTVRINGVPIPSLTVARSEENMNLIGHIYPRGEQAPMLTAALVKPDVSHSSVKVSSDSRNGCHHHTLETVSPNAITWEFTLRFNQLSNQQCIRCETDMGGFQKENPSEAKRTYSSVFNNDADFQRSRLDSKQAWSPQLAEIGQWMQIELDEVKLVEGVYIQAQCCAGAGNKRMVLKVQFEHSTLCDMLTGTLGNMYPVDDGKVYDPNLKQLADGASDDGTVLVKFSKPIALKCLKIVVMGWREWISMRAGLSTKSLTDTSYGRNIWLNSEGQIVVDLEGNVPRRVVFRRKFVPFVRYPLAIGYIAAEKVIYLYNNRTLLDSFVYTRAVANMPIRPGFLGCFAGDNLLSGTIGGFQITADVPWYRPSKEMCFTMRPPVGFVDNPSNWNQTCAKIPCDPPTDRATCCLAAKSCAEYVCPSSTVLVKDASQAFCTDLLCTMTPHTVCCQDKQLCSDMKCDDGFEHVPYPRQISCAGMLCAAVDHETCCRRKTQCRTLECPARYSRKDGAWNTTCAHTPCTAAKDLDRCCAKDGTCDSYKCPPSFGLKPNPATIFCKDPACLNTNFAECCVSLGTSKAGTCPTHTCGTDMILKEEAAALLCKGATCEKTVDDARCCEFPEKCAGMFCPAGTVVHGEADTKYCKKRVCDVALDRATCCVPPGRCNIMKCPASFTLKGDAANILCQDRFCKNTDFKTCCAEQGKCTTWKCTDGLVQRPEAKDVFCEGMACAAVDNARCCVKPESCIHLPCPANMVSKANVKALLCKDYKCSIVADVNTCCAVPGMCTSFACPSSYTHSDNASGTFCVDSTCKTTAVDRCCALDGACVTHKCPAGSELRSNAADLVCYNKKCGLVVGGIVPNDDEMCCAPMARCSTATCPKGKTLKGNAVRIACKSSPCGDSDVDLCCDNKGMCSTMKCPVSFRHLANADQIMCGDKDCNATGWAVCCGEEGKCETYKCPAGYASNPGTKYAHCSGFKCTANDRDRCCLSVPTCGAYTCPTGWGLKDNATVVQCKTNPCSVEDMHTCCNQEGRCPQMKCPDSYIMKADASSMFCKDKACINTPVDQCCQKDGKCDTFLCPTGKSSRPYAKSISCKGFTCLNGVDDNTCCENRTVCNSAACTSTQTLRADFATRLCLSPQCTQSDADNKECCANKGMCTLFKCPDGFRHRHNASDTMCGDDTCKNTKFDLCCAEDGKCLTHSCPAGWVHRPSAEATLCKGRTCVAGVDDATCCSRVSTCGSYTCPPEDVLKAKPLETNCAGATCTSSDSKTCCARAGRCDTFLCPAGWNHRSDAPNIWCDGDSCNTTDFKKCCQEDGHCSTMACPTGYVQKQNLTGIKCSDWTCQAKDRDICCEQNTLCAEVACPAPMILKAKRMTLQCGGKPCNDTMTCTSQNKSAVTCQKAGCFWDNGPSHPGYDPKCVTNDQNKCCAQPGTCSMMACPDNYLHVFNAHLTPCKDLTCNQTGFRDCCVDQNACRSYTCPTGYDYKSGYEQLFCRGAACDDSDRDACCTHVATCDTHVCPKYQEQKDSAYKFQCKKRKCKSPFDDKTCCVPEASCGLFTCPWGMSRKPNAKDILCDDKNCSKTHYTKCCDEHAKCRTMKCKKGFVLRPSEKSVACSGVTCDKDKDHDLCCDPQANCGSYKCPEPYAPKHKAQKILCRLGSCTDSDLHTCCATPDTCGHFPCPLGFGLISNAQKIPLTNATEADYTKCCAPVGSCGTFHCPAGLVLADDAASKACTGTDKQCTADDESVCCQAAATCLTMQCKSGFQLRPLAPFLFCEGKTCKSDSQVDSRTCCAEVGKCGTFACPATFTHKFGAWEITCPDSNCSQVGDDITSKCCGKIGSCDSFNCKPVAEYLRKPDASQLDCREAGNGGACSDADLGVCCDRRAKCSKYTCPRGYVWRPSYASKFCAGLKCVDDDRDACCDLRASCTAMMPAPPTFTLVTSPGGPGAAASTAVALCPIGAVARTSKSCAGKTCTADDAEDCCVQSCLQMKCPAGYVNKTDKEAYTCSKVKCTGSDVDTCCDQRAQCSSLGEGACPKGTVNRGSSTLCAGPSCSACTGPTCFGDDRAKCCGGSCASFTCPQDSHVGKKNTPGICATMNCTSSDMPVCCSERASCSSLTCPSGTNNRGASAMCGGSACQASDLDFCCGQSCENMTCPGGYSYKANYLSLLCNTPRCDPSRDVSSCCSRNLLCQAFTGCPAGTANVGAKATCAGPTCSTADEAKCCADLCSNPNYQCPDLYVKKANAATISCTGRFCGEKSDSAKCCEMRAKCTTMECGKGIPIMTDKYCAGCECMPDDRPTCCQAEAPKVIEALPTAAPAPCIQTDEANADFVELTFKTLDFKSADQAAVKAELKKNLGAMGVTEQTLGKMDIRLREGSVIAELRGLDAAEFAEIRAKPLSQLKIMGVAAVVTAGAEPPAAVWDGTDASAGTATTTTTADPNYLSDDFCFEGWKPHAMCAKTFTYKDVNYTGCTSTDRDQPWCQLDEKEKGWIKTWEYCKQCVVTCKDGVMPDPKCKPKFTYKGKVITGCTNEDFTMPWCYIDDTASVKRWANCTMPCNEGDTKTLAINVPAAATVAASAVDADFVELTFKTLDFKSADQAAFKAELKKNLGAMGVTEQTLGKMDIRLREGSVIAELRGLDAAEFAEIRAKPLSQLKVMGVSAEVTKGAQPLEVKVAAIVVAPTAAPTSVKSSANSGQAGAAGTTGTTEPPKESNTKTMFIVFCIVLLSGALFAMVAMAVWSYTRRAPTPEAAQPLQEAAAAPAPAAAAGGRRGRGAGAAAPAPAAAASDDF